MEQRNPIVLVFNKFYLPGYRAGGPIRTIENMVEALSSQFDFYIVTLDRDLGANCPYDKIKKGVWQKVGKARVAYQDPQDVSMRLLLRIILSVKPDVVYLNSFFDPTFTQRILWARRMGWLKTPVVLAPRGEFSKGALAIKPIKKIPYLLMSRLIGLHKGVVWHASSEYEHKDILNAVKKLKTGYVVEARNVASKEQGCVQSKGGREYGSDDSLDVCFLSRISPKKNLTFALRVLQLVKVKVNFFIYGPIESEEYWKKCERLIDNMPENVTVKYNGEVNPSDVKHVLSQHELFFFPTLGENYGHVIQEALSAGLPVLISDQTPWDDIDVMQVGWARPLASLSAFSDIIEAYANFSDERREVMSQNAIIYSNSITRDSEVLDSNINLFRDLIFRRSNG